MGDGVLIYFGYPEAHEDDAERAVSAGLELVAAVGGLKTNAPLQTRIGIATGLVVVGDLIGSGASQEQAIVGETPNLAARLQGVAEPNSVAIAESTRKLVGNLFVLEDLGALELKGISGLAKGWVARRPSSVESRFDAFHASGLTELFGRNEELELLFRCWSQAKSGEGQVVLLSGEPGIGKSRLAAALLERVAAEPHIRLRYFCSPQHTDSALYPIITQMGRAAGFAHGDTAQAKLDKLDAVLAQTFTGREDAAVLAQMLSLQNDGRYPILPLTPQQHRQKTLEALTTQLEALSRSNPVVMIFEDVHWLDPTSLEFIGHTVDRLKSLPVFLTITYRPEFDPPWIGRPYVAAFNLTRLGEQDIAAMIDCVAGDKTLPTTLRQDIIERTDGIPLFVEEMTKAVMEAGVETTAEQVLGAIPSASLGIPASLHASLMARLDRLGPTKVVAQIGAVIGREFSHALLAAVSEKNEGQLKLALDRHRALAPRFGQDIRVAALSFRGLALWLLGYPELALADAERTITDAQEVNHGPTSMYALHRSAAINIQCGDYAAAKAQVEELIALATQKGAGFWNAFGMIDQGIGLALTGNAVDAVQKISSAIYVYRSMGSTVNVPEHLWHLAKAHAQLCQMDDAWRWVDEAKAIMWASGETWCEAELHRVSGEIALMGGNPDVEKAEAYLQYAVSVARQQQAKSWELRAATSLARLWRDQGKRDEARELLAPVYGWFTEGFDTLDLKQAKAYLTSWPSEGGLLSRVPAPKVRFGPSAK
jgi:predicted ATPase